MRFPYPLLPPVSNSHRIVTCQGSVDFDKGPHRASGSEPCDFTGSPKTVGNDLNPKP